MNIEQCGAGKHIDLLDEHWVLICLAESGHVGPHYSTITWIDDREPVTSDGH